MSVAFGGIVAQTEQLGASSTVVLTLTEDVAPSIRGAGTVLQIFVIWGPGGGSVTGISDDVVDPGTGAPPNNYYDFMSGGVDTLPPLPSPSATPTITPCYPSAAHGGASSPQVGTTVSIIEVSATWGFKAGDEITITLGAIPNYIGAYAFLFTGDGVLSWPVSHPSTREVMSGGGGSANGETNIDSTISGGTLAPYTWGTLLPAAGNQFVALTVLEGSSFDLALGGGTGDQVPGTIVQDTDDIVDGLGVWTEQVSKAVSAGDLLVDTATVYKLWTQEYVGASQDSDPLVEFASSPSRRTTSSGAPVSPQSGVYWVVIKDVPPPAAAPAFNHIVPA